MAGQGRAPIVWDFAVPLVTNPVMIATTMKACGLAWLIMTLLLSFVFATQGEWEAIPPMATMSTAVTGGLAALFFVVMLLVFGNRLNCRFTVDGRFVRCDTTDRTARAGNRLAIILGILARRPGLVGAGLIGRSQESMQFAWKGVDRIACDPARRTIRIYNRWRMLLVVYCTADNYEAVAARVRDEVARHRRGIKRRPHPLPRLLGWTAAVVAATFPVFVLPYPFELDLLLPMLVLGFAVATVWLVPLFGYVVVAGVLGLLVEIVAIGTAESVNHLTKEPYINFEYVDGDEWVALAIALAGLAFLTWFSWRAVRGRTPCALADDMAETT